MVLGLSLKMQFKKCYRKIQIKSQYKIFMEPRLAFYKNLFEFENLR